MNSNNGNDAVKYDVAVFGAGIVGVSTALHLQAAGRSVALLDRHGMAGLETSYGNAGLVERASIIPYGFPRALGDLIRYGLNRSADVHYHATFLPKLAPFLFAYWRNSSARGLASASRDLLPLIEGSVREHEALICQTGDAERLFTRKGWLKAYRNTHELEVARVEAQRLSSEHGLNWDYLDASALRALEPDIHGFEGALHWKDPITASDPGAVSVAYANLFLSKGGMLGKADALSLRVIPGGWEANSPAGPLTFREVVIALGPWSADVLSRFGYTFPLAIKRGYHMHYRLRPGTSIGRPILDGSIGYVLAPMAKGVRLTTAVEMAPRDAKPTPYQLKLAERKAREVAPIDERVEATPWMGFRPVFADMRPAIGRAPRHENLWVAFGHGHHGFTMGPGTGRLMAELMTGKPPHLDPKPFSPMRFGKRLTQ